MQQEDIIKNLYEYYTTDISKFEDKNIMRLFKKEGKLTEYILKSVLYNMTNMYKPNAIHDLFRMDLFLNGYQHMTDTKLPEFIARVLGQEVGKMFDKEKYTKNWHEADLTFEDFEKVVPYAEMSNNGKLTLAEIHVLTHKDYPQDKKDVMYGLTGLEKLLPQTAKDIFLF